jgi:hypothetical protein
MGEFGFIQTVKDNMILFSKQQIAGANWARDLFKKMIFPSTRDFRANVSAGCVPSSVVTLKDVKATKEIWGRSVLKMKGNMGRRNSKKIVQSIIKVLTELMKIHWDVELAMEVFYQQTHLLHDLQHGDMLLYSQSSSIPWERIYLGSSPGNK